MNLNMGIIIKYVLGLNIMKKTFTKYSVMLAVLLPMGFTQPSFATESFMNAYNASPYAKAAYKGNCALCHTSSGGGGSRNSFGDDFSSNGESFTKKFMTDHPSYFNLPEGGFLSSVDWDIAVTNLTPSTNGALDISLLDIPKNRAAGSHVDYKISVAKSVSKYLSFSKTAGTINITDANNISTDNVVITPSSALKSAAIAKKLAKKPMKFAVTIIPLESDGKTKVTSEQSVVTVQVSETVAN